MWRMFLTIALFLLLTACATAERDAGFAIYAKYADLCGEHARQVRAEAVYEDRYNECMAYQVRNEVKH